LKTAVIIPVKYLNDSKKRLAGILDLEKRRSLTELMLLDVLEAIAGSKSVSQTVLVSPDERVLKIGRKTGAILLKESGSNGVNEAVAFATQHCMQNGEQSTLVLPADLPLLKPENIERIAGLGADHNAVITPSRQEDGTNALLRRPPDVMKTFYDNDSYRNHLLEANRLKISIAKYLAPEVTLDIDSKADLQQFLKIAKKGRTLEYLSKPVLS